MPATAFLSHRFPQYVGANVAMLMRVLFGNLHHAYRFNGGFSGRIIVLTLLAQHGPELVCDVAALLFELRLGLPVAEYFASQFSAVQVPMTALTVMCLFFILLAMRATSYDPVFEELE